MRSSVRTAQPVGVFAQQVALLQRVHLALLRTRALLCHAFQALAQVSRGGALLLQLRPRLRQLGFWQAAVRHASASQTRHKAHHWW